MPIYRLYVLGALPSRRMGSCKSAISFAISYFCFEQSNRCKKKRSICSALHPAARLSWISRTGRTPVILPQGGRMPVHWRSRS